MTAQARLLGGRYQVGELLGYGGMAEVHRGRDLRLGRDVAIKMLRTDLARDDTFQLRFRREAQNAASLNHPAIVAVYDTGEERGPNGETLPYIIMEFVNGHTLKEVLAAEGRLLPRRALEITAEICSALEFSHRHNIIHRDIKPGNVMLTQTGQVKVMDFGIARALASGAATMTQTSAVIGTAQYLSPEQARGESVDARSDVYATGCVLFELVCGQPPFVGDSPVSVAYQHVREDAKPPSLSNPDVPPALDSIVLKALTKNPFNRYQSAGEMRADLLRAAAGRPVHAEPVLAQHEANAPTAPLTRQTSGSRQPPPARVGNARRRRTSGWAIAALTALAVLAVAALTAGLLAANQEQPKAKVPDLVGMTNDQATNALSEEKLKAEPTKKFDPSCELDKVLSQETTAGTMVELNSVVRYHYCGGPKEVVVPNLVRTTTENAEEQLKTRNLKWKENLVDSELAEGLVISTSPKAGTTVAEGDVITLEISKGNLVKVPNVAGLGYSEATALAILKNAGFSNVETVDTDTSDPDEDGRVVQQDPGPGTAKNPKNGSTVIRIFVARLPVEPTVSATTPSPTPSPSPTS